MPRRPRAFVEGIYHLGSRGSETRHLFLSDRDRASLLERLALCERFELRFVATPRWETTITSLPQLPTHLLQHGRRDQQGALEVAY
jgi:hypothetical protein